MRSPHLTSLSVILLGIPLTTSAAEITWQAPANITSESDINTNGTLVRAINATTGGDSLTINAGGENILFSASDLGPVGTGTSGFFTGSGGNTGNTALNTVLQC